MDGELLIMALITKGLFLVESLMDLESGALRVLLTGILNELAPYFE